MGRKSTGDPNGRTEKHVDWARVDNLLKANCTGIEIASNFDMHPNTFYLRVKEKFGVSFTEYSTSKKQTGDSMIKEAQFKKAVDGDNTMLIWLGKVRLSQSDIVLVDDSRAPNDKVIALTDENIKLRTEIQLLKEGNNAPKPEAREELLGSDSSFQCVGRSDIIREDSHFNNEAC